VSFAQKYCNTHPFSSNAFDLSHCQLGAINGLPFLLSSHIMTDLTMVCLRSSVRAVNDKHLQRIQEITRMNPDKLIGSAELEAEFKQLMRDHVNFVKSMHDKSLDPSVQRMYATRKNACEQADDYVSSCVKHLKNQGKPFIVSDAKDFMKTANSRAELKETKDIDIQSALDRKVREPRRLILHVGAIFEATVNADKFSQSQIMMMTKLPPKENVYNGWDIPMLAAPAEFKASLVNNDLVESDLIEQGWTRVNISLSPERLITTNGTESYRSQYTLR